MQNQLLRNIYYGYEMDRADAGTSDLRAFLDPKAIAGSQFDWELVRRIADGFFAQRFEGVFGGQITLGDGYFLAAFMSALRPSRMVEIGVASGYSSAFILTCAASLSLIGAQDHKYLQSIDLVSETSEGLVTGSMFHQYFPDLAGNWELHTHKTSLNLLREEELWLDKNEGGSIMAFVDGGHNHPWPLFDIAVLRRRLPVGSWVVLQDSQMMERWLADCVEYGVPCPPPVRGVNLAVSHYPGTKILGTGLCYNCAALQLDVDDSAFESYVDVCARHRPEIDFNHWQELLEASRTVGLGGAGKRA